MSTAVEARITPAEYLALERPALERSEFFDGVIRPMARSNRYHSTITVNVLVAVSTQLLDRPGNVFGVQMRTRIGPAGPYVYPDVVAVAGDPHFEDAREDNLLDPDLIVEVSSPATEAYDRGEKFERYRRCESLREYVLVSQDRVLVERFRRQGDDWLYTALDRLDDVLRLDSIGCEIPLRQVYAKTPLADRG